MSANLMFTPCRAYANAVVVNVNEGTMTVSSGPNSNISDVISSASVQDVVSSTSCTPTRSRSSSDARRA